MSPSLGQNWKGGDHMAPSLDQTYAPSETSKRVLLDDHNRAPSYEVGREGAVSMMVVVDGDLRDPSHHWEGHGWRQQKRRSRTSRRKHRI